MITLLFKRSGLVCVAAALLLGMGGVQAQQRTGNFNRGGLTGGGGGVGGTGGRAGTGSSARQYYPNGTVGDAMVSVDPETRRLIVITDDETSRFVSQVITNLDKPRPQVLIKVVFLEATYNDSLDLGLEGATKKAAHPSATSYASSNLFGLASQSGTDAGLYTIAGRDFEVTLRALAQNGSLEVLSRPSILARNNQQASILVGQEIPVVTNVRYDSIGGQVNTVQYQDVGIILRVTPFIGSDNTIEMIVSPEISALDRSTPIEISRGVTVPIINKRSADTVVVTPDGQPVVIGGLMESTKLKNDGKIPFLGDIPGLGNLFKRQQRSNTKTELMIFLTPHIVSSPAQLAANSAHEENGYKLGPKAFPAEELDRFVDRLPVKKPDAEPAPDAKPQKKRKR